MRREFGCFSSDEAAPQLAGAWRVEEEDFPQEIIAISEGGLGSSGMGPDHDLSVFGAPLAGCMGKGESEREHGQELGDALGMRARALYG